MERPTPGSLPPGMSIEILSRPDQCPQDKGGTGHPVVPLPCISCPPTLAREVKQQQTQPHAGTMLLVSPATGTMSQSQLLSFMNDLVLGFLLQQQKSQKDTTVEGAEPMPDTLQKTLKP